MVQSNFDYVACAQRFCQIVRERFGFARDYALSDRDMRAVAERYGICGAFNTHHHHWRLLLSVGPIAGSLEHILVYDPACLVGGKSIYQMHQAIDIKTLDDNQTKSIVSSTLVDYIAATQGIEDLFKIRLKGNHGDERSIRRFLNDIQYGLILPKMFDKLALQKQRGDCGPAVLYAALIACLNNPLYNGLLNHAQLSEDRIPLPENSALASSEVFKPGDIDPKLFRPK